MDFSKLKSQSKLGSLTNKLVKEIEKTTSGSYTDERLWKPTLGKDGTGSATIRFLPAVDGEEIPWVKLFSHGFQGPKGWYMENSLTTLNELDPVTEYNRELWNTGDESKRDIVRKSQKRKLNYYSNIYVLSDPANADNNGKVFLFKYGKSIFDIISSAMNPEFEDVTPIQPFDFWRGANLNLRIIKKHGYWNYEKSSFDTPGPLFDDDDALERIWKMEYPLQDIISRDKFKTYEQLEQRLHFVLGIGQVRNATQADREEDEIDSEFNSSSTKEQSVMEELESSYRKSKSNTPAEVPVDDDDEDADDMLKHFAKLAE